MSARRSGHRPQGTSEDRNGETGASVGPTQEFIAVLESADKLESYPGRNRRISNEGPDIVGRAHRLQENVVVLSPTRATFWKLMSRHTDSGRPQNLKPAMTWSRNAIRRPDDHHGRLWATERKTNQIKDRSRRFEFGRKVISGEDSDAGKSSVLECIVRALRRPANRYGKL